MIPLIGTPKKSPQVVQNPLKKTCSQLSHSMELLGYRCPCEDSPAAPIRLAGLGGGVLGEPMGSSMGSLPGH